MLWLPNLINKNVFISEKHQGKANWPDVDREISLVVPDPTVPSPTQLCFCSLTHSDKPINVTQTYHIIAWKYISIWISKLLMQRWLCWVKRTRGRFTVKVPAVMTTRRILPRVDCVVHDDHAVDWRPMKPRFPWPECIQWRGCLCV